MTDLELAEARKIMDAALYDCKLNGVAVYADGREIVDSNDLRFSHSTGLSGAGVRKKHPIEVAAQHVVDSLDDNKEWEELHTAIHDLAQTLKGNRCD